MQPLPLPQPQRANLTGSGVRGRTASQHAPSTALPVLCRGTSPVYCDASDGGDSSIAVDSATTLFARRCPRRLRRLRALRCAWVLLGNTTSARPGAALKRPLRRIISRLEAGLYWNAGRAQSAPPTHTVSTKMSRTIPRIQAQNSAHLEGRIIVGRDGVRRLP